MCGMLFGVAPWNRRSRLCGKDSGIPRSLYVYDDAYGEYCRGKAVGREAISQRRDGVAPLLADSFFTDSFLADYIAPRGKRSAREEKSTPLLLAEC